MRDGSRGGAAGAGGLEGAHEAVVQERELRLQLAAPRGVHLVELVEHVEVEAFDGGEAVAARHGRQQHASHQRRLVALQLRAEPHGVLVVRLGGRRHAQEDLAQRVRVAQLEELLLRHAVRVRHCCGRTETAPPRQSPASAPRLQAAPASRACKPRRAAPFVPGGRRRGQRRRRSRRPRAASGTAARTWCAPRTPPRRPAWPAARALAGPPPAHRLCAAATASPCDCSSARTPPPRAMRGVSAPLHRISRQPPPRERTDLEDVIDRLAPPLQAHHGERLVPSDVRHLGGFDVEGPGRDGHRPQLPRQVQRAQVVVVVVSPHARLAVLEGLGDARGSDTRGRLLARGSRRGAAGIAPRSLRRKLPRASPMVKQATPQPARGEATATGGHARPLLCRRGPACAARDLNLTPRDVKCRRAPQSPQVRAAARLARCGRPGAEHSRGMASRHPRLRAPAPEPSSRPSGRRPSTGRAPLASRVPAPPPRAAGSDRGPSLRPPERRPPNPIPMSSPPSISTLPM
eukprot:scaffold1654_cov340-Prasinococcus_capsulatus_cf.AAC.4